MIVMKINEDRSERLNYSYVNYPIYIRESCLSEYPDYKALAHWHDDIELMYILSGEIQYNVNGKIITITKGNGIFINTKQMHFGFSSNKKECQFICVRLHPMLLCINGAYEQDFVLPILSCLHLDYIYLNRETDWQSQILQLVIAMNDAKESKAAPLKIQNYFTQIWIELFENTSHKEEDTVGATDFRTLKRMIGYIQKNYSEKLSLSKIASAGAVGQSKCCKLFAQYIGQTPNSYLINYRLQKCVELLQNTDMTMTEIALATGFCGSSYFAESFRKKYGISPRNFRERK